MIELRRAFRATILTAMFAATATPILAQTPQQPTTAQAREMLRQPETSDQVRRRVAESGLTSDQIRARLQAAGYPANLLDAYLDSTNTAAEPPARDLLASLRLLGLASDDSTDVGFDTMPPRSRGRRDSTMLRQFGLDVFADAGTRFIPNATGPVDAGYVLGAGDVLVLILTGDVEDAYTLEVTREGFVVVPQVGQLYVANLTLGQLDDLLYRRLGAIYSGVHRGSGATTRFSVSVARLRAVQIYVLGDVASPGSYQLSGAATILTALYAAGGPTANGSMRRVLLRRGAAVADSLDLYDYLLAGDAAHDARLHNGDIVFVPVRGVPVSISGEVTRPAIYELRRGETLRDLLRIAGSFTTRAEQRRVQIHRVLPPEQRGAVGRERIVVDVGTVGGAPGELPAIPLVPGDSVTVFAVGDETSSYVELTGNVHIPGRIGFRPGMRLSEAIRAAGGPRPDVYLDRMLISRRLSDTSRVQLHAAFADSTGRLVNDVVLADRDEIEVFSRTEFRVDRYVVVTGAVREGGRVPYREGMTLRDAVLLARGLSEDAWLGEAEIARLPDSRDDGRTARTVRVPLDSTYVFARRPDGTYDGPPGLATLRSGAPEVVLRPYDNVLVFRQPDWELQRKVMILGQVRFPGEYALETKSDRLSDLVARAGGLNPEAYPLGLEFHRRHNAQGRVGLDFPRVVEDTSFRDNLIMLPGDSVVVPEYNPVVRVGGAVNSPTSVSWVPGKGLSYYVRAAGGEARNGDAGRAFVSQPNGKVEGRKRRFLIPDGEPEPLAGAAVLVPERDPDDRKDWVAIAGSVTQVLGGIVGIVAIITSR